MKKEFKASKVAVCPVCSCFVLACHVDHLSPETEQEFDELFMNGYVIKTETAEETKQRAWENCDCDKTEAQVQNFLSSVELEIKAVTDTDNKTYILKDDVIKLSALFGKALSNLKLDKTSKLIQKEDKIHRNSGQKFHNKKMKYKAAGFAKAADIVDDQKFKLNYYHEGL